MLKRLKDRINDILQRMQEMAKSIQDEHLNEDAMKAMEENDLVSQLNDIQKKLQGDKVDEAPQPTREAEQAA